LNRPVAPRSEYGYAQAIPASPDQKLRDLPLARFEGVRLAAVGQNEALVRQHRDDIRKDRTLKVLV
jgi:hypothetical protein